MILIKSHTLWCWCRLLCNVHVYFQLINWYWTVIGSRHLHGWLEARVPCMCDLYRKSMHIVNTYNLAALMQCCWMMCNDQIKRDSSGKIKGNFIFEKKACGMRETAISVIEIIVYYTSKSIAPLTTKQNKTKHREMSSETITAFLLCHYYSCA